MQAPEVVSLVHVDTEFKYRVKYLRSGQEVPGCYYVTKLGSLSLLYNL